VLEWFEQHHIPVDAIAGTSMGCMVSALYSTGLTVTQLKTVMNDRVFGSVFSFTNAYTSRSFRRREDSRELPNGLTIGLKHRVSFRNSVLTDQGLNAFLDRQFLRYDDQTDFNTLPIPLRCISTDLNEARAVTFARGSLPDAVRASVSLPGVYQPFEMKGHEYVDGGVLQNLPTSTVHDMQADVVLAVSLPLAPVETGDLNSILGVLGRSFSVAIEGAERQQRKLADVVLMPDLKGFGATDYLKAVGLAERGYAVAEANRETLLKYALSDADWEDYQVHLASLRRGPAGPVLRVRVTAPNESATRAVQQLFAPLVNQPVDTRKIEALLDQVRSDGRYQADYTVGYETAQQFAAQNHGEIALPAGTVAAPVATAPEQLPPGAKTGTDTQRAEGPGAAISKPGTAPTSNQPGVAKTAAELADRPGAAGLAATKSVTAESLADISARPILLVTVTDKKTGPPNLLLGANLQAQTTAFTRATIEGILINQDFGSYGSELRTHVKLGYLTQLSSEYFHPLSPFASPQHTLFVAPYGGLLRQPFPIYRNQIRVADRQLQSFTGGGDLGWTNQRTQELRAGFDFTHVSWQQTIGNDALPDYIGTSQRAHLLYTFDTQDRALVPQFGLHLRSEAGYLYATTASPDAPQLSTSASYAHRFSLHRAPPPDAKPDPNRGHEVFILSTEAGTMFHRNVAEPFRYTLGGPLRLSASAIDQYRGTDYLLIEPMLLRRIAQLPQPLGQSIYLGAAYEFGQMYSPNGATITRHDVLFGIVAETPLGVITLAPAIGSNGERKFVFTLGRLF
jgi:NTE family protein